MVLDRAEGAGQTVEGRAEGVGDDPVDVGVGTDDERQSAVDQGDLGDELRMPGGELDGHEAAHRMTDDRQRSGVEAFDDRGQIRCVGGHPVRAGQLATPPAAPEVRRDDPDLRQLVGDRLPGQVVRGDPVHGQHRAGRRTDSRPPRPADRRPPRPRRGDSAGPA